MNALFVLLSPYLEYIKLVVSAAAGCWGAYTWMDKRNKQSKVLQYAIADALVVAQAEVNRLERELAEAIRFDPHHWLVLAKREKKDRNDGRFAAVLLNSTAERKKDLFEVFASLSKHFLTLYAGSSDEALLFDATRFGNIAFNLQPNDPEIKKIVAELAILGEIQNLTYIPGNHDLFKVRHSEELDPLMISSLEALEFIARLKQDTRKYFDQQLLLCAAIAAERARD